MGCFGGADIPQPQYTPPFEIPPMPEFGGIEFPEFPTYDPEAAEAKRKRAEEVTKIKDIEQRRHGNRQTLLTGGAGDESAPMLKKPSLLGS
jgi:hypothetical protein